jgi:hypothetical protein
VKTAVDFTSSAVAKLSDPFKHELKRKIAKRLLKTEGDVAHPEAGSRLKMTNKRSQITGRRHDV